MSIWERRKAALDEAVEGQSGASREDARRYADENMRYEREEARRRAREKDAADRKRGKRPLMTAEDKEDWRNVLRRHIGWGD